VLLGCVVQEYERFKLVQLQQQAMMPQPVGGMQQMQQQSMPQQQQQQQQMMLPSSGNPFSLGGLQYQMVPGPAPQMSGLAVPSHHQDAVVLPPLQQQQQQMMMMQVAGGAPVDLAATAGFACSMAPSALQPPTPFTSMAPLSTGNQLAAKLQALGLDSSAQSQAPVQQGYGGPLGGTTGGMLIPAGMQAVSMGPVAGGPPAWLPASSFACATSSAPSSSAALGFVEGAAAAPMALPGDGTYGFAAGGQGADAAVAAPQGSAEGGSSAQALANLLLAVRDRGMLTTHTTIGDLIGMLQQQA
jgi:hypothetical protein